MLRSCQVCEVYVKVIFSDLSDLIVSAYVVLPVPSKQTGRKRQISKLKREIAGKIFEPPFCDIQREREQCISCTVEAVYRLPSWGCLLALLQHKLQFWISCYSHSHFLKPVVCFLGIESLLGEDLKSWNTEAVQPTCQTLHVKMRNGECWRSNSVWDTNTN